MYHRPPIVLTVDRPPVRRLTSVQRPNRASPPPIVPRSGKHRQRMLKGAMHSLAILARVPVSALVAAAPSELLTMAGRADRPGDACRLAAKVLRLLPASTH